MLQFVIKRYYVSEINFLNYAFREILVRWQQACSFWFIPEQITYEATSNNREVSTPDGSVNIQSSNQLHHQYNIFNLSSLPIAAAATCMSLRFNWQANLFSKSELYYFAPINSLHTHNTPRQGGWPSAIRHLVCFLFLMEGSEGLAVSVLRTKSRQ